MKNQRIILVRKTSKKAINKVISLFIVMSMFCTMLVPVTVSAEVPAGLETGPYNTLYTAAQGNIARNATPLAIRVNASTAGSMNNGALATSASGTLNTWGISAGNSDATPMWVMYNWDQMQVVEAMRVMWHIYTDTGVTWPTRCKLQYLPDGEVGSASTPESAWVDVPNGTVGVDGNSNSRLDEDGIPINRPALPITPWGRNTAWNVLRLDEPIVARSIRLHIVNKTSGQAGIGVSEWEVFGYQDPARADLAEIDASIFNELTDDIVLPTTGTSGCTITWSGSTNLALSNDGTVTRPAIGQPDAIGTITATAVSGTFTATKDFTFSVLANLSDEDTATTDLASIDLGNVTDRVESLTFPTTGRFGSDITWDTEGSRFLWKDGTVIRPPSGLPDATITVTATATSGSATETRTWTVTIPAYPGAGKSIVSYEPINVDCPAGNAPKLPNSVKVTYSNGDTEIRKIQWSGATVANQTTQAGYPVGHTYTMTGNIIGDNATTNGFQVTANITVVAETVTAPSNTPVAETLPLHDVEIDNDPNGDVNRLTLNRDGHIQYILGINVTSQLYNYRETFGLSTTGYATPSGWDSRTTKLKGHGHGHYMSGLAMAYSSGATAEQKDQLLSRMKRMTDELREMQEMTFVRHEDEDRFVEARDRYTTDAEVNAMTNVRLMDENTAPRTPEVFGYGYINAIQPEHLILIENYAPYNGSMDSYGVWAPHYSLHKQLAGLLDIYYALDGGTTEEQAIADKAFAISKDMGMWVWNRLHYRTYPGFSTTGTGTSNTTPGRRDTMWGLYIAGEYGGINETMARLSDVSKKLGNTEDADRLLQGSLYFDNNGSSSDTGNIPYFSSLANNRDSIRTLHANQHIPQIIGALWNFKVGEDDKYYNMAENFWDYVVGRYSYTIGGVGGNTTNSEKFIGAYNQISRASASANESSCETCAAYNMLKLTKDLNAHNPDDAKYMDYYERLFYNQMVGSIVPGSRTNQTSYGYSITLNGTRSRGASAQPGGSCCSGTGTENHVKYQEATYFTSKDKKAFYVGLYLPSTAKWEAQDATITQSCVFPSQESTFKVTPGASTEQFEMKFRVPYWATEDFDIKLNGTSLAASYEPSSYVTTGVRTWTATDTVVVTMPFEFNVDYLPGKYNSEWYGNLMNGPLVMAATGVTTNSRIELDSYLKTGAGTSVTVNAPTSMTGGADGGVPTNNVPNLSVEVIPGLVGGTATTRTFAPHYFVGSPGYTTYFYIPAPEESVGVDKTPLFNVLQEAKDRIDSGMYTDASIDDLETVLATAAAVYQSASTTEAQMLSAIDDVREEIGELVAKTINISVLEAKLTETVAIVEANYTPESFSVLTNAIEAAQDYIDGNAYTDQETADHTFAVDAAMKALVLLDFSALQDVFDDADGQTNPLNLGERRWPEEQYTIYTRKSWNDFLAVKEDARAVLEDTLNIPTQSDIDAITQLLKEAMDALLPSILCDEREPLSDAIEAAKLVVEESVFYTDASIAALQAMITFAEEDRLIYASLTFLERDGAINQLQQAIDDLVLDPVKLLQDIEDTRNAAIAAAEEAKTAAEEAKAIKEAAEAEAAAAASAAEDAEAAATLAAEEAAKAADEAVKAKIEADKAKSEADKALEEAGKSEAAKLAAEAAQAKAEEAQGKAVEAQGKAVEAQTAAETAQGKAVEAQGKAVEAQTAAETARGEALTAKTAAETAATAAQAAKTAAETAKTDAVAAKEAADAAKNDAVNAKNDAVNAKTAAETAKTAAETARTGAEAAKEAAEAAKTEAVAAKLLAEAAVAAAQSAQAEAEVAKAIAVQAALDAQAFADEAENSRIEAEKAKEEALKAKEDALKAAADALQKTQVAEAAAAAAEKAKKEAEAALKVANNALKVAQDAQKDTKALSLAQRKVKIKSAKPTKGKIKVTLKKDAAAVKYQVQYSSKKNFKGKTTKSTGKTSYTFKKLKKGTYYVRARAYTLDSKGKKVYSKWSAVKTVKVKK